VERDIRPELGHLKVAGVTRQDLHKLHAVRSKTPRQADMILSVCSKIFNLAEVWEMRPEGSNPCRKIERYWENHRERFLSGEELARQFTHVPLPGNPYGILRTRWDSNRTQNEAP
jgi:hypothetical protein